jgi:hypothetical protein
MNKNESYVEEPEAGLIDILDQRALHANEVAFVVGVIHTALHAEGLMSIPRFRPPVRRIVGKCSALFCVAKTVAQRRGGLKRFPGT